MQALVTQILLPITLGVVMLGMGLGLTPKDFSRVAREPKASLLGMALQLGLLPLLAIAISWGLDLPPAVATGLFLVSLCPGGATSNLFTLLARGDVALSVTLTAVISLLAPFWLPMVFVAYLHAQGTEASSFSLPLMPAIMQLVMITILPVGLGMTARHLWPHFAQTMAPIVKKGSALAMLFIVTALLIVNPKVVSGFFTMTGVAVILLATVSLFLAYWLSGVCGLAEAQKRTIGIEVGVQNAGTAMMVAFSVMHEPALAVVPLTYGLLMNVPAAGFLFFAMKRDKANA